MHVSPPFLINTFLLANHYLFPSIPNVHTFSTQTTGTVMQVYFHDGSHLPSSPLMSLAHLRDDSQHISLAAICLSAFTANQTSEQPYSLMGGGLETSPACLSALPHPILPLFPFSLFHLFISCRLQSKTFKVCFVLSSKFLSVILLLFLSLCGLSGFSPFLLRPSSIPILPIFVPVGRAQRYICLFLRGSE